MRSVSWEACGWREAEVRLFHQTVAESAEDCRGMYHQRRLWEWPGAREWMDWLGEQKLQTQRQSCKEMGALFVSHGFGDILYLKIIDLVSLVLILVKYTQHRFYLTAFPMRSSVLLGHFLCWVATIFSIPNSSSDPKPLVLPSAFHGPLFHGALQRWIHVVLVLCDWLISLGIMSSRFLYVIAYDQMSLFLGMENIA